jgi:hypothetical protein
MTTMPKQNHFVAQTPAEIARDTEKVYRDMLGAHSDELSAMRGWKRPIRRYLLWLYARRIVRLRLHLAVR